MSPIYGRIIVTLSLLLASLTLADDSSVTISPNGNLFSINATEARLGTVLADLAKKSGNQLIIQGVCSLKVNVSIANISFENALYALLKGNQFTCIKRDSLYIVADECLDTLMYTHLVGNELYGSYRNNSGSDTMFNSFLFNKIPIPIKNNDMVTDSVYLLRHVKVDELLKALPEKEIKAHITADREKNALLLHGTMEDLRRIETAITSLDTPREQVRMDVLLVEFKEGRENELGVEIGLNTPVPSDVRPDIQMSTTNNQVSYYKTPFSTLDLLGDKFYARLKLLVQEGKANILAKPSLSVISGHEAVVEVNQTNYYKVETGVGEEHTSRFQPIKFGISLRILPTVMDNKTISALIEPEISNSDRTNNEGYPNVSSRKITSTVQMEDGKTLVLGGLVKQNETRYDSKVPFLGDIPLLGALFKHRNKTFERTNLCIYITPHIIQSSESAATEEFERTLKTNKFQRMYKDLKDQ